MKDLRLAYPLGYTSVALIEVRQTDVYTRWFRRLRDRRARIDLRIDCGPGYRVYFLRRGSALVILLVGGDKSSQQRDIARARSLARGL